MGRLEQLQALLTKEPDDSFLNFGVAMELAKQQRYEESLTQFDKTIALQPSYIAAHFQKGRTLLSMGDEAGARAALEEGIRQARMCGETHAMGEMQELLASL